MRRLMFGSTRLRLEIGSGTQTQLSAADYTCRIHLKYGRRPTRGSAVAAGRLLPLGARKLRAVSYSANSRSLGRRMRCCWYPTARRAWPQHCRRRRASALPARSGRRSQSPALRYPALARSWRWMESGSLIQVAASGFTRSSQSAPVATANHQADESSPNL